MVKAMCASRGRRVVEPADVERVEAGVTNELLSRRARVRVGGEDARRRDALVCDLVVDDREVRVEALRGRTTDNRLDLERQRLEAVPRSR
jgi:hypothetical protein